MNDGICQHTVKWESEFLTVTPVSDDTLDLENLEDVISLFQKIVTTDLD